MEERNIGIAILLSVVTCGIYGIYWMYKAADDLIRFNGETDSAGVEILLGFVTCGIYTIYWNYKMGKRLFVAQQKANVPANDDSILYLILSIFGLGIISLAIIQSNMNKLCYSEPNGVM